MKVKIAISTIECNGFCLEQSPKEATFTLVVKDTWEPSFQSWLSFSCLFHDIFYRKTYSVLVKWCAQAFPLMGHEPGHNFGAGHNQEMQTNKVQSQGHGHLIESNHTLGYRTIMAYKHGDKHLIMVNYYFNPNVVFPGSGTPTGIEPKSNNALVISSNRFTFAGIGDESSKCKPLDQNGMEVSEVSTESTDATTDVTEVSTVSTTESTLPTTSNVSSTNEASSVSSTGIDVSEVSTENIEATSNPSTDGSQGSSTNASTTAPTSSPTSKPTTEDSEYEDGHPTIILTLPTEIQQEVLTTETSMSAKENDVLINVFGESKEKCCKDTPIVILKFCKDIEINHKVLHRRNKLHFNLDGKNHRACTYIT